LTVTPSDIDVTAANGAEPSPYVKSAVTGFAAPFTIDVIWPESEYSHAVAYAVEDTSHAGSAAEAGADVPHAPVAPSPAMVHADARRLIPSYR
jgi:hypothetical protein